MVKSEGAHGIVRDERGFTLIELLVVVLILGLLASIATPAFFDQSAKAHDSDAKATVNTVVKLVEACRVNAPAYSSCDTPAELADSGAVAFGGAPGQAGVAIVDQGFLVYAISKGKTAGRNHIFAWQRNGDGTTSRFCLNSALQPLNGGGCRNSAW